MIDAESQPIGECGEIEGVVTTAILQVIDLPPGG